jgi:tetratricopeptide (TPR) repeat protein
MILAFTMLPSFCQEHMGRGRIMGTVVDENRQPLEGVLIVVEGVQFSTKLEGTTDEKGHFAVAGMGTGFWRVTASKKGYDSAFQELNVSQLSKNPPVNFTLKKITGVNALLTDETSIQTFDKGNELLKEGKYDESLKIFEELQKKFPEVYQMHLNTGSCYLKKGDVEKAKAEFEFVLDKIKEMHGDYKKDTPAALRALTGLGEIALKKEDFETAQIYFSQALDVSPEDEVSAYNVGEIFFSNKKIDEAIKYFDLAIQIKKDWSKPYLKLGYAYINKGNVDKSLEYFSKFIEVDPENPEVPHVKNMITTIKNMKK